MQWQWLAVLISLVSCLCLSVRSRRTRDSGQTPELIILGLLLLWMLFQLAPLPSTLVAILSPNRWNSALAARIATGVNLKAWLPLSVAPAATLEQLLNVLPAMAIFVGAREMGRWWGGKGPWIAVAPVIAVALLESLLGLSQFYSVHAASTDNQPISGSYVNRNHFAGLLELALPLTIMWAVAIWNNASKPRRNDTPALAAIRTSGLLVIAACILAAVVISLSRGGFIASLMAIGIVSLGWLLKRRRPLGWTGSRWFWLLPMLLPVVVFVFLSTNAMVLRFAEAPGLGEVTTDGRVQIWKETIRLIGAYKWTGTGLGAYEYGLYPFKKFGPDLTVNFAHNDYLQIFAELGLVGGGLVAVLAGWIFWKPLSVLLQRDSKHWALALGLLGSFVAIGLHSIVDFNLYIPANALAVAWLAGIAVSPALKET